jgi:hypothetical protein
MIMKCADCPINCLGQSSHPIFCSWWASGDPTLRAHVRARSELGPIDRASVATMPPLGPPGLLSKVVNRIEADIRHVASGMRHVDEPTLAVRLGKCRACPGGYWRASDQTCQHPRCGCAMAVKATRADAACPIGEWGAV